MAFFFKQPAFGLDISDYSIELLSLDKKADKFSLLAYNRIILEKGIVENGKILDKEKLREKIKELVRGVKPRGFKGSRVVISLPESKTFFHVFQLPEKLKEEGLEVAVEKEALKTIPLKSENIYSDFRVVSIKKGKKNVLYVGVAREIVDDYLEVLRGAGLNPLAFSIESASLSRAFEKEITKEGDVLIVDIGARTTVLTVFDDNSIRFSAIIPVAGNDFTQAISEKLKVSPEEAEGLKRKYRLDSKKKEGKVLLVLQNVLRKILAEVKDDKSFYEEKSGRKIKKVLLCGGSSLLPELVSYFSSNLPDLKVELADPFKGILLDRKMKKSVLFSNVIGLAKRASLKNPEKAGINLMPKKERSGLILRIDRKIFSAVFIIFFLILACWLFCSYIFKEKPLVEEEKLIEELTNEEEATATEEVIILPMVVISETQTGWLRVREGPGTNYSEIAKVYPGESYPQLEEFEGWYRIELEEGKEGWVFGKYIITN
ncbi:MAG: type IV pilus assembly protein PilM [bacterium]